MRDQKLWLHGVVLSVGLVVCGCASGDDDSGDEPRDKPAKSSSSRADDSGAATEIRLSGPVSGGKDEPFTASSADLAGRGYSEKEFFLEGGATAYSVQGTMTMDGKALRTSAFRRRPSASKAEDSRLAQVRAQCRSSKPIRIATVR
jgi:hypothetical protein